MTEHSARKKRTSKPPANIKQSPRNDEIVRRMFAEGKSLGEIAKEIGVARTTVGKWCRRLGLKFDATPTVAANLKSGVNLAAGRLRLAEKMLAAAEQMVDNIDDPYLVYNFGGKDNTYVEHLLDTPPVEIKRSILVSAAVAFDKITRIVEADPDVGTAETAIRAIQRGLQAAAEQLQLDQNTKTILEGGANE